MLNISKNTSVNLLSGVSVRACFLDLASMYMFTGAASQDIRKVDFVVGEYLSIYRNLKQYEAESKTNDSSEVLYESGEAIITIAEGHYSVIMKRAEEVCSENVGIALGARLDLTIDVLQGLEAIFEHPAVNKGQRYIAGRKGSMFSDTFALVVAAMVRSCLAADSVVNVHITEGGEYPLAHIKLANGWELHFNEDKNVDPNKVIVSSSDIRTKKINIAYRQTVPHSYDSRPGEGVIATNLPIVRLTNFYPDAKKELGDDVSSLEESYLVLRNTTLLVLASLTFGAGFKDMTPEIILDLISVDSTYSVSNINDLGIPTEVEEA